jgi:HEAT repeat protein
MKSARVLAPFVAERDERRQFERVGRFVKSRPEVARSASTEALASPEPDLREIAAKVLGSLTSNDRSMAHDVTAALLPALERESNPQVIAAIITALGHAGQMQSRIPVSLRGRHESEDVRFAVAWALPSLGWDENVMDVLRALSLDPDDDVRNWATFGLANSEATDPLTTDALVARAQDAIDDIRAEAILGLARRRDPRASALIASEMVKTHPGEQIVEAIAELNRSQDTG